MKCTSTCPSAPSASSSEGPSRASPMRRDHPAGSPDAPARRRHRRKDLPVYSTPGRHRLSGLPGLPATRRVQGERLPVYPPGFSYMGNSLPSGAIGPLRAGQGRSGGQNEPAAYWCRLCVVSGYSLSARSPSFASSLIKLKL